MKSTSTLAALGGALALWLTAAPPALAQQTFTVSGTSFIFNDVCGNASDTTTGDCASLIASDGNTLTVSNSAGVRGSIYGNQNQNATATPTTATGNTVTVSDGNNGGVSGANAESDSNGVNATATNNTVTISGAATSAGYTVGAIAQVQDDATAVVTGNTVNMTGGTLNDDLDGADAYATNSSATSSGNTVRVSGGTLNDVYGGYAYCSGCSTTVTTSNNQVLLTGGTVGNIFGGWPNSGSGTGVATGNVVDIGPGVTVAPDNEIYGGWTDDTSTGNILNLRQAGLEPSLVQYFQQLNFFVPATFASGDAMLIIDNTADLDYPGMAVSFTVASGSTLAAGDKIMLIDASSGTLARPANIPVTNSQGYTFTVTQTDTELSVTLTGLPSPATLGTPVISNVGQTSADFSVTSSPASQTATPHWQAVPGATSVAACPAAGAGSYTAGAQSASPMTGALTGLQGNTSYGFCIYASNAAGNSALAFASFQTLNALVINTGTAAVPALGPWALALLALLLGGAAAVRVRRYQ